MINTFINLFAFTFGNLFEFPIRFYQLLFGDALSNVKKAWFEKGSVCIVTGANTGVGKETAKRLAKEGAHVILACRNLDKAGYALEDIKKSIGDCRIEAMHLDLSSLDSVRRFVEEFEGRKQKLHVLVNNAGILTTSQKTMSKDGMELTWQTNHVGHYLLTTLLIPSLAKNARIITVASIAHRLSSQIYWEDPNFKKRKFSRLQVYGHSKLANILFAKYLQTHLDQNGRKDVLSAAVHPGAVATELYRNDMVSALLGRLAFKSQENGARCQLFLALAPTEDLPDNVRGGYFAHCMSASVSSFGRTEKNAQRLWEQTKLIVAKKL